MAQLPVVRLWRLGLFLGSRMRKGVCVCVILMILKQSKLEINCVLLPFQCYPSYQGFHKPLASCLRLEKSMRCICDLFLFF